MGKKKEIILVLSSVILLSAISFFLVAESAGEEPFLCFSSRFAYTQILLSGAVIVFWAELLIFLILRILSKRSRLLYSVIIFWSCFVLYWQILVPVYYISDVVKFSEHKVLNK